MSEPQDFIAFDHAGAGHPRYTHLPSFATLVKQPWMRQEDWTKAKVEFFKPYPLTTEIHACERGPYHPTGIDVMTVQETLSQLAALQDVLNETTTRAQVLQREFQAKGMPDTFCVIKERNAAGLDSYTSLPDGSTLHQFNNTDPQGWLEAQIEWFGQREGSSMIYRYDETFTEIDIVSSFVKTLGVALGHYHE